MAKKVAAVLLCMLLAFSLAACKGNVEETENTSNISTTKASSVAESNSASTTSTTALTTEAKTTEETATHKNAESTTAEKTTAKETAANTTTTQKQITTTTTQKQITTTAKQTTTKKTTTTTKKQTTTKKTVTTTKANYNVNSSNSNVKEMYNLVNQERSKNGLSKYAYRNDLQSAANTRAKEIATDFSHTRPNGTDWNTVSASIKTGGENIAYGKKDANAVMNDWMNSAGHRNNILNSNFTGIAIGCYEKDGVKYYVQLFVG